MKIFFLIAILFIQTPFTLKYPNKPIEFIVGFSKGGSADRMSRNMAKFLKKELKIPINIINKKTSLEASNYVLNQSNDGYTIFSSTFSPYIIHNILNKEAKYSLNDFEIINLQWFDSDFIAVNKTSKFNSIISLLEYIKKHPKSLSIAVINKSNGHLLLKILFKKFNIPLKNLKIQFYKGGKSLRIALLERKVNILITSAQGSEQYRDKIKPLAVFSQKRLKRWDAPTINEAIKSTKIQIPNINVSMRGFAVSKKFKLKYPQRFKVLEQALEKTLAKKQVQRYLKQKGIGYTWLGPKKSKKILQESYEMLKKYTNLLNN